MVNIGDVINSVNMLKMQLVFNRRFIIRDSGEHLFQLFSTGWSLILEVLSVE